MSKPSCQNVPFLHFWGGIITCFHSFSSPFVGAPFSLSASLWGIRRPGRGLLNQQWNGWYSRVRKSGNGNTNSETGEGRREGSRRREGLSCSKSLRKERKRCRKDRNLSSQPCPNPCSQPPKPTLLVQNCQKQEKFGRKEACPTVKRWWKTRSGPPNVSLSVKTVNILLYSPLSGRNVTCSERFIRVMRAWAAGVDQQWNGSKGASGHPS